jgi:hypothetical protein
MEIEAAVIPGETYLGSQGSNLNYNDLCFPETEDGLPAGWNPLHVQNGYKQSDSVVFAVISAVCSFHMYSLTKEDRS